MSSSAAVKRSTSVDEILNSSVRNKAQTTTRQTSKETESEFANIKANTFYSIMFSEAMSPEEKKEAVAKALTFEGTKEQNRERIKEFEMFKEYLQAHREKMAQEIIKLTDTETFAELKNVYEDLNNALLDFDEKMSPLTDIIDSIYTLRTNGIVFDAFKEIKEDRVREEQLKIERANMEAEFQSKQKAIRDRQFRISDLSQQKSFFGFGGIKPEAEREIEILRDEIENDLNSVSDIQKKLETLKVQNETNLGEFAEHKEKLRELLDISSDEHKERQKALVDAALNFVTTSKERVGSVRQHLGRMNDQVENLYDSNGQMTQVYAVLNEAIKDAEKHNQTVRDQLLNGSENENTIARLQREQKKMEVEGHITMLDTSAADTITTFGDLTSQAIRIKTMKDANDTQIAKARQMYTQGVAGVADRLSVVLQAVSGAALGESSSMAQDTLSRMSANTNKVAQKESIRIAMGIGEQNSQIDKAIEDLAAYGEITKAATNITREGVIEMREKLAEMERIAKGVREDISESIAINAEVGLGVKKTSEKKIDAPSNPFKL